MTRRSLALVWLVTVLFSCVSVAVAETTKRPNIVFCFADDWGRYASIYAEHESRPSPNQIVKTPNIDRIARNGVLFKNAFVTAPSCTPCRSSLLSGQYFFRTGRGAILNGAQWDSAIPSFPLMLKDAGYHIGETWKVWSPGTPNDAPFGAGKHSFEKAGGRYNNFSENVTKMVANGQTFDAAKEELLNDVGGNFDSFLKARPDNTPFLYWFGPTLVHRLWEKDSGKKLWGIDPDQLKGKLPKFLPDVPEVRADFADYLGEIQAWDAGVGEILKKLEAVGELNNTVIVISGDHGAPGFPSGKCNLYSFGTGVTLAAWWPGRKGGRVVDDFVNLMDLCPTFLEIGGVAPTPQMTGKSLVNVLKSESSGQVDASRSWVITGRERHVGSAREGNLPYPQRAIRTKDFLYVHNFKPDRWPLGSPGEVTETEQPSYRQLATNTRVAFADMDASETKAWLVSNRHESQWKWHYEFAFGKRPQEELFDLRNDPDEIKNVANDPTYRATLNELRERLMNELKAAADPRVTGDGNTFEKPPFVTPG